MVALLFPDDLFGKLLQARTAMHAPLSSTSAWPYDQIQRLIAQLQQQEPLSGASTNTRGEFDFPKPVARGTYLIVVGIPTAYDKGQRLEKGWPTTLLGKQKVMVAGREITLPARSVWFAQLKVEDGDRDVRLDKHDFITWPQSQPSVNDWNAIQRQLQEIQRHDGLAKSTETQRAAAEQKARQSLGQPELVRAMRELEKKALSAAEARDSAVSELDLILKRLFPDADGDVEGAGRTVDFDSLRPAETVRASGYGDAQSQQITNSIGLKLTSIPAREFMMGSPDAETPARNFERPQHKVRITKPFYLGVYEVTQAEYVQVTGKNTSYFSRTGDGNARVAGMDTGRCPVEMVSWEEAVQFCQRLSSRPEENQAGRVYRLPTEAEWEYACRAGTARPFHFGGSATSTQANFNGTSPYGGAAKGPFLERTMQVGSYAPNAWGLYDMHGNVCEWCSDFFDTKYYDQRVEVDPRGPATVAGNLHVLRGGAWNFFGVDCRSAIRERFDNQGRDRSASYGFRVVCEVDAALGRP